MPTIDQIKDGKHLDRCLEAYFALHRTLDRCCVFAFIDSNQKIEKEQRENVVNAIAEVSEYNISKQMLSKIHTDLFLKPSKLPVWLSCRKNLILSYPISQDFSEILWNFLNCFWFYESIMRSITGTPFASVHALYPYFFCIKHDQLRPNDSCLSFPNVCS